MKHVSGIAWAPFAIFASFAVAAPFGQWPLAPGPESWTFKKELAERVTVRAHWTRSATAGELDLSRGIKIVDRYGVTGNLTTATDDLARFLADLRLDGGSVPLVLERQESTTKETYSIAVSPEGVTIRAGDDDGMRRGIYRFERRVLAADAPALASGSETRAPWLRNRISRCFFGPIKRPPFLRDELADDVDYYPAEYLNRLAHEGINGLWLTIVLDDMKDPRRIAKLRETVRKCLRYGIRTWVFMIEPRSRLSDDPVLTEHPDWKGSELTWKRGTFRFCLSSPEARAFIEQQVADVFTAIPELGGVINISNGERQTSCLSALSPSGRQFRQPCPRCAAASPGDLHRWVVEPILRGARKGNPDAELISWFYQPQVTPEREDWVYECAAATPKDVTFLYNFESGVLRKQLGRLRCGGDYWQSVPGPAQPFRRCAEAVLAAGSSVAAKIQVGCSHELATLPFMPVPGTLYRKYAAMRAMGCSSVMQCWYFGNYPGVMNEAAGELAFDNFKDSEKDFLMRLAKPDWGKSSPEIVRFWTALADAYVDYPLTIMMQYYGPFHAGIAWPLLPDVNLAPLTQTWIANLAPSGDAVGECMQQFTIDEVLSLASRMCEGLDVRTADGRDVLAVLNERHADNPARRADIGVMEALRAHFFAARRVFEFYWRRREAITASRHENNPSAALREIARMDALLVEHAAAAQKMSAACRRDSRLGFHSEAEAHQYFPARFDWCTNELASARVRLATIAEEIRAGRPYPLSDFERTAPEWKGSIGPGGEYVIEGDVPDRTAAVQVYLYDEAGTSWPERFSVKPVNGRLRLVFPRWDAQGSFRTRPGWMHISQNGWQWPVVSGEFDDSRLELGSRCGGRCGRIVWPD